MASNPTIPLTTGGVEYIKPFVEVMASAFSNDVITRHILLTANTLPNDTILSQEAIVENMTPRVTGRVADGGAELVEAGNWAAAALWFPPGYSSPPPDPATSATIIVEYVNVFTAIKKKYLGERQYWYLNLIGRHQERTEPGVIRAIIDNYLNKAKEQGLPAWLESTNTHARDVYTHLGFRMVEEVKLGVGKADVKGNRVEGGEGITMYAMIAEP